MPCDYYIEKSCVVEYRSEDNFVSKIILNTNRDKGYILCPSDEDSDDDKEEADEKYYKSLYKMIKKKTYIKFIFSHGEWIKPSYKEKYQSKLDKKNIDMSNIVSIYKDSVAWSKK
jgi:hypothetical protein